MGEVRLALKYFLNSKKNPVKSIKKTKNRDKI